MAKSVKISKNIQTGNEIEISTIGEGLESVTSYGEIIEADRSSVYCSVDATGYYFAMLEERLTTIAVVRNAACIDDALSDLEAQIGRMIEDGDNRSILRMWHCPQTLGV